MYIVFEEGERIDVEGAYRMLIQANGAFKIKDGKLVTIKDRQGDFSENISGKQLG